nr:methyltransferase domain-containing protein [Dissulfurirhabdus thermomarina]
MGGATEPMTTWIPLILAAAGLLFLAKAAYVAATASVYGTTRGALFVPTAQARVRAALDALSLHPGQHLVDLGCGDGRVLRLAARRHGARATGFELNPLAYLRARLACRGLPGVSVRREDFWKADLSGADAVFCYLCPDVMARLARKLSGELRPGTRVVSCNFEIPGWVPDRVIRPDHPLHNAPIYLYRARRKAVARKPETF